MKKFSGIIVFALLSMALQAIPQIVLPENADLFEQRAARELADHMERASGKKSTVIAEKAFKGDKKAFFIGRTERGLKHDFSKKEYDTFMMRSIKDGMVLRGVNGIGTIFAVYEYLERFMDVLWCRPGYTYLPMRSEIKIPGNVNIEFTPAIRYRSFYTPGEHSRNQWEYLIRNRVNHFSSDWALQNFAKELRTLGIEPLYGSPRALHGQRFYYVRHPRFSPDVHHYTYSKTADYVEMFARDENGVPYRRLRRGDNDFAQLCLSNPKTVKMVTEQLKRFIEADRKDPRFAGSAKPTLYDISQNDDNQFCKCPSCRAGVEKYGNYSGVAIEFINAIAAAIEKDYPEIRLQFFSYMYTFNPPKRGSIKLHKNVFVRLCQISGDFSRHRQWAPLKLQYRETPLSIHNPKNAAMKKHLHDWQELGKLSIWDYQCFFRRYPEVSVFTPAMPENYTYYQQNKVEIFFAEVDSTDRMVFLPLRRWMAAQSAYDPSRSAQEQIRRFTRAYYGPAAGEIEKLIFYIAKRNQEYAGNLGADADILRSDNDLAMFAEADRRLARARFLATDNPLALSHVNADQAYFDMVKIRKYTNTLSDQEKIRLLNALIENLPEMYRTYNFYSPEKIRTELLAYQNKLQALQNSKPFATSKYNGKDVLAEIDARNFFQIANTLLIKDDSTAGGYALVRDLPKKQYPVKKPVTRLEIGFYDYGITNRTPNRKFITTKDFPADGRYQYYTVKNVRLTPGCMIYVAWTLQFDISDLYPALKDTAVDIHIRISTANSDLKVERILITPAS